MTDPKQIHFEVENPMPREPMKVALGLHRVSAVSGIFVRFATAADILAAVEHNPELHKGLDGHLLQAMRRRLMRFLDTHDADDTATAMLLDTVLDECEANHDRADAAENRLTEAKAECERLREGESRELLDMRVAMSDSIAQSNLLRARVAELGGERDAARCAFKIFQQSASVAGERMNDALEQLEAAKAVVDAACRFKEAFLVPMRINATSARLALFDAVASMSSVAASGSEGSGEGKTSSDAAPSGSVVATPPEAAAVAEGAITLSICASPGCWRAVPSIPKGAMCPEHAKPQLQEPGSNLQRVCNYYGFFV